ncbi:MAG: hypothetical protein CFE31_15300 [Rhizobiales bacterium PAR1]|nr:MAG: hypothetical protein CFE31_15300 [Rhizobiales bacterium PAR1]
MILISRLALDLLAAVLLVAGLAYWWLGNLAHELIGTAMFVLIIAHNVFNRQVWARARAGHYDRQRSLNGIVIMLLAGAMTTLLATSIMLSRDLIGLKAAANVSTARQMHSLAAYWGLVFVALHIGIRWRVVMLALRNAIGLTVASGLWLWALRAVTFGIALHGIRACTELALSDKLLLIPSLDLWDFNEAAARFFVNHLSIMVLIGALAHYTFEVVANRKRGSMNGVAR